ncbi:MAG: helix-turn-helix domain-containing protein [Alphaproteobacteria bacterium]|nr:helix-turn-helix domain-containing protein [Alphaproteobacteria bacterium]MBO6864641.1 helix-turn-helix domain-containing protein [Alphaproteobacteria bacterium]
MNQIIDTNAPVPVPRLSFDTQSFGAADRLEAWRENIGVFFDLSAVDGGRQESVERARIDACSMAGTVFGVTTADAQLFERSERRVARDAMEHFLVQVFLHGGGRTRDGETIQAGDMLIIDLDQPHSMVTTDFSNLTLVLPRELHSALSDILARLHARRLPSTSPVIRLLASHLQSIWHNVGDMTVQDSGATLKGTIGLMECWLSQRQFSEDLSPEVSSGLAKSIFRYIDAHIEEALSPDLLCTMFRVSRSQLYRIFKPYEGVSRYLWERRMVKSMRMLSNPIFSELAIGSIAFRCGFSSEPHFSRSFKERFGVSPSAFRREALNTYPTGAQDDELGQHYRQRFASWIREL